MNSAPIDKTTEPAAYAKACNSAPRSISVAVSRLKALNVVNPPSTPAVRNARNSGPKAPFAAPYSAIRPVANEPATLTIRIAHGNAVVPMAPARANRSAAPMAPPAATQRSGPSSRLFRVRHLGDFSQTSPRL